MIAIPSAIDPPSWGAGRRPPRQDGLDARSDAGRSGGGLLGLPWSMAGGWPTATPTDRNPPTEPRPSWNRSALPEA